MIKTIHKNLENGIYTKKNIMYSNEQRVRINNEESYLCNVSVDDIFDMDGNKLYKVEQHIEINGDYKDYIIFDYQKKHHI